MTQDLSLHGRAAVVTGAARGIGYAVAESLAAHGCSVVLADLEAEVAADAAAKLSQTGSQTHAVRCDVREAADVEAAIATWVTEFGRIDVMVNNAGITRDATLRSMDLDQFRAAIDVHLHGAWLGTRYASLAMRERKSGSIINMSSISGKVGNPGQTNYSAAKAGIVGLTKAAAKELAHLGIRVNAIQPGLIRTPMTESMPEHIWDQKLAEIPMGRAGEPAEVAAVALFLASDLSSYMTGTVQEVTGGRYM